MPSFSSIRSFILVTYVRMSRCPRLYFVIGLNINFNLNDVCMSVLFQQMNLMTCEEETKVNGNPQLTSFPVNV